MSGTAVPLTRLRRGQSGVVERFGSSLSPPYRRLLSHLGINRRSVVTLVRLAPLGDPLQLQILGSQFSLRASEARHIYVDPAER